MNNPGIFGIEFVLPSERWRTRPKGTRTFADLFHELSPYKKKNIRTRALRRLFERSVCILAAVDLDTGHHGHTVGIIRLEVHHVDGVRYGQIHDLIVSKEYRCRGIGTRLIKKALSVAADFKFSFVEAAIKPARTRAKKRFVALGFKAVAVADGVVPDSEDWYRFEFPKPSQSEAIAKMDPLPIPS